MLIDGDGDTSPATLTITVQNNPVPTTTAGVASVDDDGLIGPPAGNPASVTGDLNANTGEAAPVNLSEAVWHGQLVASGNGDTIVNYSFELMDGLSGSVGTETVDYAWNAGTIRLRLRACAARCSRSSSIPRRAI